MKINNDSKRDFCSIMNNIAVEKDPEKKIRLDRESNPYLCD